MASLSSYLDSLSPDRILRIEEPIDLDYAPTAIVLELEKKREFPVLYMEQPLHFDMPVVTNIFADRDRIAQASGARSAAEFNETWIRAEANPIQPRIVDSGPVQEIVDRAGEVDVRTLPISRHFKQDAGRYIGSGILICKDPDTGVRNLSFQRMLVKGADRFGASLHSRGHIWEHLGRCEKRGRNLEVAVVIGAHPAIYVAAAAKVAMDVDELDIAGALLGKSVDLVPCKTIDVEVPAEAEIVIEGEILANTDEAEGPYGEYTGYSTFRSTRNAFVVKAITRRSKPIFLDIIPGYSAEHLILGRSAKEAHVFNRLKEVVPNVRQLNYPKSGTHFHAYLALDKTAEGQARQALMVLLGLDSYLKLAVAVDGDVDIFNEEEVLWAIATRFQADTDLFVVPKVLCSQLDPSSQEGMGSKMGIDATAPHDWDVERTTLPKEAVKAALSIISRSQFM